MALTADRYETNERPGAVFAYPQKASTTIYAGALVFLDTDGYAEPATAAQGKICAGVAIEQSTNAGSSGDAYVRVKRGVFAFSPYSGDEPLQTNVGSPCYAYDDEQVGLTKGLRSQAGTVVAVQDDGEVWVDVHDAPANVNAQIYTITAHEIDLDDEASVRTHYFAVPADGRIKRISTTVCGASTATANAVLTFSVNGVAITGGVVTIDSGSSVGTIDSATPTALNGVTTADYIKLVVSGAQSADAYASISILIEH